MFFTGKPPVTTATTYAMFNPPMTFSTAPPVWSPFGVTPSIVTNQTASGTQPSNIFASNLTGTTAKFGVVSGQGTTPIASTTSNIFGVHNTITTPANPFATPTSTASNTLGNFFHQPLPTTSPAATPWKFGTGVAVPTTNIFGTSTSTIPNPFDAKPFATPATNPFVAQPVTTQSVFNFPTNPSTAAPFQIGSHSVTPMSTNSIAPLPATNIFGVPISTTNTMPIFPGFPPSTSVSSAGTIFSNPVVTTVNTVPTTTIFGTQPTVPFSFPSTIFGTNPPAPTTTGASISNPLLFSCLPTTQTQPVVTSSSSSTIPTQVLKQEQNPQQAVSYIREQFLAASLLDPYANRGKKDFTNLNQLPVSTESTIVTTSSTTSITTSTPIPVVLPLQSNHRKVSPSRSSIDVNFKLKPVSSSQTLENDIKSTTSIGPTKSTLTGSFTDEEELVLLGRTKLSKLRLSNDIVDSSQQSNTIRSLYPIRRLAELEKITHITPPSSPATPAKNEHTSPSNRSTASLTPKPSSSPIIEHKLKHDLSSFRLPILTRDDYYMKPTLAELKSLFSDQGQCILKQFTVGHETYGSVTFYGQINVAGLNLDEIIIINRHEVTVYPDDHHKPSVSEELNLPARITLLGVYPIDRTTREEITDMERIKAMNYNDHLRETTKKFDGEFIRYGVNDGSWTFMVKHFTRYGLDNDDVIIQSQQIDHSLNTPSSITSNCTEVDKTNFHRK